MKKTEDNFFPSREVARFRRAVSAWLKRISERTPALATWAKGMVRDDDVFSGLVELVCWKKLDGPELLDFLLEQRTSHVPAAELRRRLRKMGKRWKDVERQTVKAIQESDYYLGELRGRALDLEHTARLLAKFFIEPVRKRPLGAEIADCKRDILCFLRKRRVGEVNEYGWILLRAVFECGWKAGKGKDQVGAFRAILEPFRGKITSREKAELVLERAKLNVFAITK